MSTQFKPYPDSGTLKASGTKKGPKSPDYWGTIAIDLKNRTNVHIEDGLTVVKLSGWKKVDRNGKTYLSIAVDRFVPEQRSDRQVTRTKEEPEEDMPF
jgi:hypothetical protein